MWTPQKLSELATGYWGAAALSSAVELGVFELLADKSTTAADLADELGASELHLDTLLTALVTLKLLRRDGSRYGVVESVRPYLDPHSPSCMLHALRFNTAMYPVWGSLTTCVREGRPVVPPTSHLGDDPARTEQFVRGMHSRALGFLRPLVEALNLDGRLRLLDIGAGPGTISRELARRHDGLSVTQLDLPPVLDAARAIAAEDPADGIAYCAADYRSDALPDGFDAVLYCGALHQEDPDSAKALCGKLFDSLSRGGICHIVDLMLDEDHAGPSMSALFSLNMLLTSLRGRVFAVDRVVELLERAGFIGIETSSIPSTPYRRVSGLKDINPE
jgi:SAM-dependent methyltransferase